MKYFYTPKNADFSKTSIRAMYEDTEKLLIEYNEGETADDWQETTRESIVEKYGDNPLEREPEQPKPQPEPPKPTTVHISREDFDLLDVTYKSVTYYIEETDGAITMKRGEE